MKPATDAPRAHPPGLADWGAADLEKKGSAPAVRTGAAVLLVAVAAMGASALLVGGPAWGIGAGLMSALAALVWVGSQGRLALRSVGARPLPLGEAPRLENLTRGLAADLGARAPRLLTFDGGPNALVCRAGGPALGVSRTLIDELSRTELEAVVAHCLVRLRPDRLLAATLAVALGPLAPTTPPEWVLADDLRAAALVRFPPALAAAIAKAAPQTGRFRLFWFVSAEPGGPSPEERRHALLDL
jgi:hypothetical protein